MRKRFMVPVALCAGLALAALPAAALADGTTVTVGTTAQLVAGVEVDIPVTVTCALPPNASGGEIFQSIASVEEAVGKSIAHGQGGLPGVPCDGASHAVTSRLLADTSGPPFKPGQAVTAASVFFCFNTPTGGVCGSAGSGPVVIDLKR